MGKIVAIGGGQIRMRGTLAIDQEIIRLSQKKHPRLLFIPTASSDSLKYWNHIQKYFCEYLGCRTDVLFLLKEKPTKSDMAKKILSADIIYVGGGNTLKMMRLWRRRGVDRILGTAYRRGKFLCGISAGSICWFESGHSDSLSFYNPRKWKYIRVRGLGFIRGIHCPHFNGETLGLPRREHFKRMISRTGGVGIAIDNNCAIVFVGKHYRVLTSKSGAGAFRVYRKRGGVVTEKLVQRRTFSPTTELYEKNGNEVA